MKVGIVTVHYVDNFGTAWQCYALSSVLKELGHKPFIVNYRAPQALPVYHMPKGKFWITPRMLGYFKKKIGFNRFRSRFFPAETQLYTNLADLQQSPPVADALVAGSDQIWNPSLFGGILDPAYFLNFGKYFRKVAYAASFGESRPLQLSEELRNLLSNFNAISVRESAAADRLKEAYALDVEVACDPALLIDDYGTFLHNKAPSRDFLFCYNLFNRSYTDQLSANLAEALNCDFRRINDDWKFWKYSSISEFGVGPVRWLNLINHSRVTISDSFHATVFSIILKRDFLVVLANKEKGGTNRIVSLLCSLGLEHRIISDHDSTTDMIQRIKLPVDWTAVDVRLKLMREKAIMYLLKSLSS